MIDAIIARLLDRVADFKGRVDGAGDLSALMKRKALPAKTPAAHVIPGTLRGGQSETGTGAFIQATTETFSVIITVRSHDRVGEKGVEPIDALKSKVIAAIAGWTPDGEVGVFEIAAGSIFRVVAGAVIYQIDFRISDQVRILP